MKTRKLFGIAFGIFLLIAPSATWGMFSWVNISNPSIEQLDTDSYRLRFKVDWGGDNMQWGETDEFGPPPDIEVPPAFNYLDLSLLGTNQYNPTLNFRPWDKSYSEPGLWHAQSMYDGLGLFGAQPFAQTVFGYDFDYQGSAYEPFLLNFNAKIEWSMRWDPMYRFYQEEYHSGMFSVYVIPESPTIILMSLALLGFGVVKRFGL
jgi:hypothetical protein